MALEVFDDAALDPERVTAVSTCHRTMVWRYPSGNKHAEEKVRRAAEEYTDQSSVLVPVIPGDGIDHFGVTELTSEPGAFVVLGENAVLPVTRRTADAVIKRLAELGRISEMTPPTS